MAKWSYSVQGLSTTFTSKDEAFRQARNLAAAGKMAAERLGKKYEGIRVTRYAQVNEDQPEQAPHYVYNGEMQVTE